MVSLFAKKAQEDIEDKLLSLYDPLQEHLHLSMDHLDHFTPQTEHGPLGTKAQRGPYQEKKNIHKAPRIFTLEE